MTTALLVCEGCSRHVRSDDRRCPFCDADVRADRPLPWVELPRGASRAAIFTVSATLALGACQGRGNSQAHDPDRRQTEAHPLIVAPYGAPPPPPTDAPPAVRQATWLVTISSPIAMAARATTPLQISATNYGPGPLNPQRERLRLRVNGEVSPAFDLAFNNGVVAAGWTEIAPNQTARDARNVVEALMPAPGEYMLALEWDGQVVARRSVTVTP